MAGDAIYAHPAYHEHHVHMAPGYVPHQATGYSYGGMGFWQRADNWRTLLFEAALNRFEYDPLVGTRWTRHHALALLDDIWMSQPNEGQRATSALLPRSRALLISGCRWLSQPRPLTNEMAFMGSLQRQAHGHGGESRRDDEYRELLRFHPDIGTDGRGIIVFSLGTNVHTKDMGPERLNAFISAFAHFSNYTIFWKFDEDVAGVHEHGHIKMVKWLPQRALLHNSNTALFVTHGGYNSLMECIEAGVPAVLIPLFIDQYANANRAQWLGMGVQLDKMDITRHTLVTAVGRVLASGRYKARAQKVSRMHADTAQRATLEFGHRIRGIAKPHWNMATMAVVKCMYFYQYFSIDLIAAACCTVALIMLQLGK